MPRACLLILLFLDRKRGSDARQSKEEAATMMLFSVRVTAASLLPMSSLWKVRRWRDADPVDSRVKGVSNDENNSSPPLLLLRHPALRHPACTDSSLCRRSHDRCQHHGGNAGPRPTVH